MRTLCLMLAALTAATAHAAEPSPAPELLALIGTPREQPDDLWMLVDSATLRHDHGLPVGQPPAPRRPDVRPEPRP